MSMKKNKNFEGVVGEKVKEKEKEKENQICR